MTEISNQQDDSEDKEDFFHLLGEEQLDQIRRILSSKKKTPKIWEYINEDNDKCTVLHISVYKKNTEITKELIDYCKSNLSEDELSKFINKENSQGVVALHFASFRGDIETIKLLIKYGAKINLCTKRKLNVIHYASQGNNPNSLMYFYTNHLKEIGSITEPDLGGSTPLHWAAFSSGEEVLDYLLTLEPSLIDKKDNQGYTPLHLAVLSQSAKIVLKLLQKGANIHILDKKNETPKDLAIKKKNKKIQKLLENNEECQFCAYKAPVKPTKKSKKNIIMVIAFHLITFSLLALLSFPTLYKNIKVEKTKTIIRNIFLILFGGYILTLFVFFGLYIHLMYSDAGEIKGEKEFDELLNNNQDLRKYCPKCKVIKIKDSKHCVICEKCFEDFDHHCYWINNCIAKNNYLEFLFFLFLTLINLLIIGGIDVFWFLIYVEEKEGNLTFFDFLNFLFIFNNHFKTYKIMRIICYVVLGVIDLAFLVPVIMLVILHVRVYCFNLRLVKKRNRTVSLVNKIDSEPLIN